MIRIEWKLDGKSGHGDWFPDEDLERVQAIVNSMNYHYGPGTHRIHHKPTKEDEGDD